MEERRPFPSRLRALLVGALLTVAGSASAQEIVENPAYAGSKVTIKYALWGGANEVAYSREIARKFVKKHPDIRVQVAVYPWGQYWAKMQTQAASGLAPDVMSLYSGAMGPWIARGALMPLDDFVANSDLRREDYHEAALGNCTWEGTLYCFPIEMPAAVLIYSKDRFEESGIPREEWPQPDKPLEWAEFQSLTRRLTLRNADGTFSQYGMAGGWSWPKVMYAMYGGAMVDRQVRPTRPTIAGNEPLERAMIEIYRTMYADRVHIPTAVLASGSYTGDSLLLSDKFAMSQIGPWGLEALHNAGVRFGLSPMPRNTHPSQEIHCNVVGIFSASRRPEAAWKFVRFMAGEEIQPMFGRMLKGIPSLKSAAPSLADNKFGIPDCEAYLYDMPIAIPAILTENTYLVSEIDKGLGKIDQALDNEYDRRLRALSRASKGAIAPADYDAFVAGMNAFVAETVRDHLPQMQRLAEDAFERGETKTPSFFTNSVLPAILMTLAAAVGILYLRYIRRTQKFAAAGGRQTNLAGYLTISPWLVGFAFFTIGPMIAAVLLSFTEWNMIKPPRWIGAQHYVSLIQDKYFIIGLKRTFSYAAFVIPIGLVGGLFTAGLLTADIRGRDAFKAIFYFPSLFTGAAAAVLWVNMFNKEFGIINRVLGFLGVAPINWLDEAHAFYTVVLMNCFWIGGAMIIYYAGMKQIPKTLYEAADIDGAGFARKFLYVTIPMLSPVILFMVVVSTIGAFQVFTPALFFASSSTTIGEPGDALRFYSVNIYDEAFNNLRMGKACCWAIILFVVIFIVTMAQMRISKRFVYSETE